MNQDTSQQAENAQIVDMIRVTCRELSVTFSQNDVNQALADIPVDENGLVLGQTLNAVGQRIGVRFREVESGFRELCASAIDAGPLLIFPNPSVDSSFVILRAKSNRRFVIWSNASEKTVSRGWLKRQLHGKNFRWFIAQPYLAADNASAFNYQSGVLGQPLRPLQRFITLLRPEAKDVRAVAVFSLIVGLIGLTIPFAVEALVNTVTFGRIVQPLIILSVIVFIFLAFRAGILALMTVVVEIIQRRLFVRVVDDLALRLSRVPLGYFKRNHGTELVNRFFDVVAVQKITAKLLLDSLMLILQTVIGLTVIAFYHPFLLGYDIGLIAMMAVVLTVIGKGAVKTAKDESASKYATAAWLQEIVRHPTTFKFNGGLGFAINRADELSSKYIESRRSHFKILIGQVSFALFMQAVAATALLGLGGWLVIQDQMTLGQLVAAELIVSVILNSFSKVGKDLESYYDLMASVDKLGKLFDLPGEPADKLQLVGQDGPAEITLVDLKFLRAKTPTNATVEPGTTVAITGPSGSGKTKVVETIAGLHAPVGGFVSINNFRVDLLSAESLQSQISFVNEIEVFQGTVDENLRLGRSHIDSEWLSTIVEKMGLHETITGLDEGFKTQLSISGFPLSSSQAIRLVLARALIGKPSALLIDSLLDRLADDEIGAILSSLSEFKQTTTIVVSTGRRAIAEWADQVVKL